MIEKDVLIISHVIYRKTTPYEPIEGPYSSINYALKSIGFNVETCQIPLDDFENPIIYGRSKKSKKLHLSKYLGKIAFLKYFIDFIITTLILIRFNLTYKKNKRLVIGIDPLSSLAPALLKKIFDYELIYYCVDFNKTRFNNNLLQWIYEKADKISSVKADQVWVICEALKDYKKRYYKTDSIYIPNSSVFNDQFYKQGKKLKTGNKVAWSGSCITHNQLEMLFMIFSLLQKIKPDLEFHIVPTSKYEEFKKKCLDYKLQNFKVYRLKSRSEWQRLAAKCDIGIAIYDPDFGSTKFIEPLKIWDFMMCGLPFIISNEPSLSREIVKSGVAYILSPKNKISRISDLKRFLNLENLKNLGPKCLKLAKKYDISKQIMQVI